MKWIGLGLILLGGCVHTREAENVLKGGTSSMSGYSASRTAVLPGDVNTSNGHDCSQKLWDEIDREELLLPKV